MTDERNKETRNLAVVKQFLNGTHHPDLEMLSVIDDTVSENVVTHGFPVGLEPRCRESYKQFFIVFRTAFTDMKFEVENFVSEGDFICCNFNVSVSHSAEFANVSPTGKRVYFTGMVMYRLQNEKIAETWLQIDQLAILAQIGAIG